MTQAEMATMNRPGPPVLATQDGRRPTQGQVPMPQRMAPPMMVADAGLSSPDLRPTGDTSPQLQAYAPNGTTNAQLQPVASGSSNKTLFAIVGVGLVLVLSLIGLGVALKPPAKGLLIIELPEAAAGKARVNLNGKPLTEPDGSPLKDWPQILEVPAGKNTVMIVVPGFETLTETVDVKEGNEYTPLSKKLKKKSAE
jgi:hypothetical protein